MSQQNYTVNDFIPLIALFTLIGTITLIHQIFFGWCLSSAMRIAMAAFFIIFGSFKLIHLRAFATAYSMYDLLAQRFSWYGYTYPFIELALGIAYLFKWQPHIVNSVTIVVMLISATGVFNELRKGNKLMCACLGTVFKIPMTYVTLIEDLVMAIMAMIMLSMSYV